MPWIWVGSLLAALTLGFNLGLVLIALIVGRDPN
jgi:hypothetical protein